MKKKFFAAFFGLIFCLFVGSASASAVESTTSSPTPLSESLPMLDEEYPIKRFSEFTIKGKDTIEFNTYYKTPSNKRLAYNYIIIPKDHENRINSDNEWYIPHEDPTASYVESWSTFRNGMAYFSIYNYKLPDGMIINSDGWVRIKCYNGNGTYRIGIGIVNNQGHYNAMTVEEINDYFDGQ